MARRPKTPPAEAEAELGLCGLCGRVLIPGPSVNRHHLRPKSQGGTEMVWIHTICHGKIHSLFTERQLAQEYDSFDKLLAHEEIQRFVRWVRKRHPSFRSSNRRSRRHGRH